MKRTNADGATVDNKFTEGGGTVPATTVDSTWLNTLQEEVAYVIEQESIVLDQTGADTTQLRAALLSLIASQVPADSAQAKVSVDDTTPGFLEDKIAVAGNLVKTTLNPAGNEQVEISLSSDLLETDNVKSFPAELATLSYQAGLPNNSFNGTASDNTLVEYSATKTNTAVYDAPSDNRSPYWRVEFDSSLTVTGTGIGPHVVSGTPNFTVATGDIIVIGSDARIVVTVNSPTSFDVNQAFTADPTGAACTLSQAVHTVNLNDFTANTTRNAISSLITTDIDDILVRYTDSLTADKRFGDFGSAPNIGFIATADNGTTWSDVTLRQENLTDTETALSGLTTGTDLLVVFFANKSSGSGQVNLIDFSCFFHQIV